MTSLDIDTIQNAVTLVTSLHSERTNLGKAQPQPLDYTIANTADRVVTLIIGTAKLSNTWDGIRGNDLG